MAQKYQVKTFRIKKNRWRARLYVNGVELAVAFGSSKEEASGRAFAKIRAKNFIVSTGGIPYDTRKFAKVVDSRTGENWYSTHEFCEFRALEKVEKDLPKEYFIEKHGEHAGMNGRNEYLLHHMFKGFFASYHYKYNHNIYYGYYKSLI